MTDRRGLPARLIGPILLGVLALAGPLQAAPGRVLLVGSIAARQPGGEDGALLEQIHGRIFEGLRLGLGGPALFRDVVSFDRLVRQGKMVKDLTGYSQYAGLNMSLEVGRIHNLPGLGGRKVDGYLQTTLSRTRDGLRVDLELYREKAGRWSVASMKTVDGPESQLDRVLDRVADAARRIVSSEKGLEPSAHGGVQPSGPIPLGTRVVLDASGSSDGDYDALTWLWCQGPVPEGEQPVLPPAGVMRRQIEFTPTVAGTYTFTLHVQELVRAAGSPALSCRGPAASSAPVKIEVLQSLQVEAGDSRQIELGRSRERLKLTGTCRGCTAFRWRQVSGPQVEVRHDKELAPGDQARGWFRPGPPGEYTFELVGSNAIGEKRAAVNLLIAPRPTVIVGAAARRALVGRPLELNGTASYDFIDASPQFSWEARDKPFDRDDERSCFPSRDYRHGAMVLHPRGNTAILLAGEPRTYYVRLMVIAKRQVGGQQMSSYDCATMAVDVQPRTWWAWLSGGGHANLGGGASAREMFALHLGGNRFFPGGKWGLRFSQVLFTHSWDDQARTTEPTGSRLMGGSTLGLSYTWRRPHAEVRPFVGGQFRIVSGRYAGPGLGSDLLIPLFEHWAFTITADAHALYNFKQRNTIWDLRLAAGLGHTF